MSPSIHAGSASSSVRSSSLWISSATGASVTRSVAGGGGPLDAAPGLARVLWTARRPVPCALEIPARPPPRLVYVQGQRAAQHAHHPEAPAVLLEQPPSAQIPAPGPSPTWQLCQRVRGCQRPASPRRTNCSLHPAGSARLAGMPAGGGPSRRYTTVRSSSDRAPSCDRQATYSKRKCRAGAATARASLRATRSSARHY